MVAERIEVQNVGQPGKIYRVDAAKYAEMRAHVLAALPGTGQENTGRGMAVADLIEAVRPRLSEVLFPGGETCGWWVKCVQLDLEAKGLVVRAKGSPVRLSRVG